MSIGQYVIGGAAVITAVAIGYAKWTGMGAQVVEARAEKAIVAAECVTDTAKGINDSLLQQVATLNAQARTAKDEYDKLAKKAADRLRENNDLRRKISNVTDNGPIPDALELNLDAARVRSSVAGSEPAAGRPDKSGNGGASGTSGRDVPGTATTATETPGS